MKEFRLVKNLWLDHPAIKNLQPGLLPINPESRRTYERAVNLLIERFLDSPLDESKKMLFETSPTVLAHLVDRFEEVESRLAELSETIDLFDVPEDFGDWLKSLLFSSDRS